MPLTMPTATARRRQNRLLALVLGGVATAVVLVLAVATPEASLPVGDLIVPSGFVVELVAGPPLVDQPIVAGFDEKGGSTSPSRRARTQGRRAVRGAAASNRAPRRHQRRR